MTNDQLIHTEKKLIEKITVKKLLWDIVHLFDVDRGVILTLRSIAIHPGETFERYLGKDRFVLTNPFRLVAILTAIATLLATQFEFMQQFMEGLANELYSEELTADPSALQYQDKIYSILYEYFNVVTFLCLPLMAFCTKGFYQKKGFNYGEHLVINAYVLAFTTLLFIASGLLFLFTSWASWIYFYTVTSLGFQVYAYVNSLADSVIGGTIKTLIVILIQYALFIVVFAALLVVYLIMNPALVP